MSTLISHFYNEQYLLPWWLAHHVPLFDHGILINRGSTDRSVEICRQLAPHWEIRESRVPEFDPIEVDREVMDIEQQCSGWKMTLNTTEFLCVTDKYQFFHSLHNSGCAMYFIRMIIMIDPSNSDYEEPVYSIPLVKQRHHGHFPGPSSPYLGRFIHLYPHGGYTAGRHTSLLPHLVYPSPAFVLKFVYSPWNDAMRARKLQIGPTLSQNGLLLGLGINHVTTAKKLEADYLAHSNHAQDLRLFPEYRQLGLELF